MGLHDIVFCYNVSQEYCDIKILVLKLMCLTKNKFFDIVFCYNGSQKYCDIKILVLKLMCLTKISFLILN